ncbi:sulfite exporter TauE/SafE family protein [Mariniblastus fucicola]|uniref:Urease accessory protein UreH-like transmembrane domain-containing protein n=1 Tax=Mariniblastus fucicola TaxID=980251 RepID=A0A5B9P608_9BACT|nr:sulfite exporter TauE/SafE family protein [Mariniblastus fucicola]QEG20422.1 hypothetical protein MFFC18_02700 [Mariniblastus fucicola]
MGILLGTVFVASLLGSLHCVGMCGPFALLASATDEKRKSALLPSLAYSGGRLVTYSIVGLLFGSIGLALNVGTSFNQWQQSATIAAGVLMILVGVISLARWMGWRIWMPQVFKPVQKKLGRAFNWARQLPPLSKAFTIGALTSLMPCGWLYTFAITAAGTGSPLWGMALMISFWAGTVPIMLALVLGVDRIGVAVQQKLPPLMAGLVIAIGLFTIFLRAPVAIANEETVTTGTDSLVDSVLNIDHEALPCCQGKETEVSDEVR